MKKLRNIYWLPISICLIIIYFNFFFEFSVSKFKNSSKHNHQGSVGRPKITRPIHRFTDPWLFLFSQSAKYSIGRGKYESVCIKSWLKLILNLAFFLSRLGPNKPFSYNWLNNNIKSKQVIAWAKDIKTRAPVRATPMLATKIKMINYECCWHTNNKSPTLQFYDDQVPLSYLINRDSFLYLPTE